ncbi:hypothetical protein SAMN05421640_2794 [Ekhidna lutea]|uniref:Cohesin domain-containing protein n=1 Tax=Ekhidna lutea TaxID=447679 RepID=A0A239KMQ6_EKHLU|nr:hypothetical protein [Ekhidna lutea]SNT19667.1 hypothetical protein SAMN05421640_2794 [Ekhidna lutea]
MQKLKKNLLSILGLSLLVLFTTSCGGDDEPVAAAPSVTVSASVNGEAIASGDEVIVGSSVTFDVTVNAEGGVNGLDVNGTSYTRSQLNAEAGDTQGTISITSSAITEAQIGSTLVFEFQAVDDLDQTSAVVTFEVSAIAAPSPDARSYSAVLLPVPTGDFMNENFFSVSSGTKYSSDDVTSTSESISPTIDFGYYYGSSEEASIASPKGFESTVFSAQVDGWSVKNATVLKTTSMTAAQFNETATWADIDAAFDAGTTDDNGIITNLAVGSVLAFETVDGVRGLIHISAIDPGFESNDSITLDILAQLDATASN